MQNKTDGNDHNVTEENRKGDDLSARRKFRTELAEDDVEEEEGGGVATVAPPSPTKLKKGKAALPLKSDRV
nr:50S ribosomal protein L1, chloroplastic [Tanacetum cinerariifolium]